MKLGILVPLPQELVSLTRRKLSPGQCVSVGENLTVCLTGVGKTPTKAGFRRLMGYPVDLVISWGTAAGLAPEVSAGDIILPGEVKSPAGKFKTHLPFNRLIKQELSEKIKIIEAPLVETQKVLQTTADKLSLYQTSGGVAADMESSMVGQLAKEYDLPFSVIRAVSDPVNTQLPEIILGSFNEGSFDVWRFLSKALIAPAQWKTIYELSGGFRKARTSLRTISKLLVTQSGSWPQPV